MSIWFQPVALEDLNSRQQHTLVSLLGIRYTEIGADYIRGTMPVDERTKQPAGIMHGGASAVLAETLGSTGANLVVDRTRTLCVGLELNCNHIRAMRSGAVTGTAQPLHIGSSTQVWEIKIRDEAERLVCISRITMAALKRTGLPEIK